MQEAMWLCSSVLRRTSGHLGPGLLGPSRSCCHVGPLRCSCAHGCSCLYICPCSGAWRMKSPKVPFFVNRTELSVDSLWLIQTQPAPVVTWSRETRIVPLTYLRANLILHQTAQSCHAARNREARPHLGLLSPALRLGP